MLVCGYDMQKTFSKKDIGVIAAKLLAGLSKGETATVIALSGDLGAGKTTLTQELARQLGVTETVISPTFVIMKEYAITRGPYAQLVHIDAYRLESAAELERLGWYDLLRDAKNLILIEWPEKVPEAIPSDAHRVSLQHASDEERSIEF